jgi:hypothetical protein
VIRRRLPKRDGSGFVPVITHFTRGLAVAYHAEYWIGGVRISDAERCIYWDTPRPHPTLQADEPMNIAFMVIPSLALDAGGLEFVQLRILREVL